MTYVEMMELFKPGMVARRPCWDREFSLQMKAGDEVRLHNTRKPGDTAVWRRCGYDADVDDYEFITVLNCKAQV